jgi:hypothetical protein
LYPNLASSSVSVVEAVTGHPLTGSARAAAR